VSIFGEPKKSNPRETYLNARMFVWHNRKWTICATSQEIAYIAGDAFPQPVLRNTVSVYETKTRAHDRQNEGVTMGIL